MYKILDFDIIDSAKEEFILSDSNILAYDTVMKKVFNRILLIGPHKSGRTTMAKLWREDVLFIKADYSLKALRLADGIVADDIEEFREDELLHLINFASEHQIPLLMISLQYPRYHLTDLSSRIKASYLVKINQPDDQMFKKLTKLMFYKKQIQICDEIADIIFFSIRRSYDKLYSVIEYIDSFSRENRLKITPYNVKKILQKSEEISS